MDIIEASIPLFFLLIGIELAVAKATGRPYYRLNDSIADLSLGILSQLSGIFLALLTYALFGWVSTHFAIQRFLPVPAWPDGPPFDAVTGFPWLAVNWPEFLSWTVVFLLVDLCYYWSHRLSHEVNILWAGHVVHHSSEEYNLTVALRQSSLHGLFTWVFYMPLALAGVPWQMFILSHGTNLIYQFWIHTREVNRLGLLEWFLNTPSHHRVHHGVNPRYQDRNYAGVFIFWDRWFGSFTPETEEPVYGITTPLATWNPIWANLHVFVEIFRNAARTRQWRDKLKVVFGPPNWLPPDIGRPVVPPEVTPATFRKYDPVVSAPVRRYGFAQFVAALLAAVVVLRFASDLTWFQVGVLVFYLTVTLNNLAGLLEGRRTVYPWEFARLVTLVAVCAVLLALGRFEPAAIATVGAYALVSAAWFRRLRPMVTAPLHTV
jgi:sterol desaturase/sphingolipid hydroxylase (fatty acid hydroxylase superfamily)